MLAHALLRLLEGRLGCISIKASEAACERAREFDLGLVCLKRVSICPSCSGCFGHRPGRLKACDALWGPRCGKLAISMGSM